ncbi:MAG: signal peptidase I [Acidimicrobiales bacterium]
MTFELRDAAAGPGGAPLPVPSLPLEVPSLSLPRTVPELAVLPPEAPARSRRQLAVWASIVVAAVLVALGTRAFVAELFYVPSGSMLPTLAIGDRILVDRLSYRLHAIHRGDVVVFSHPPLLRANDADLVKRVIGMPGDVISLIGGRVEIDGRPLAEPWLPAPPPQTLPSTLKAPFSLDHPFRVPAGEYFVMGDNRTNSEDSRYFGPVPGRLIVGEVVLVVWPLDESGWLVVLPTAAVILSVAIVVMATRPLRRDSPGRSDRHPAEASRAT